MLLFRVIRWRRFYKQIAGLVGEQVRPINSEITHVGNCVLLDHKKSAPRIVDMLEAHNFAEQQQMELVLLRQGDPPMVQARPYIYQIYKQFLERLKKKEGKQAKTIPISSRIQDHDLRTKKYIVEQLLKKGYSSFRLVGNSPSEENRLTMERFCQLMGWHDNYTFDKALRGMGKDQTEYWVCYVHVKDVRIPINYESLNKKYLQMLREAQGGPIKFKQRRELDEEEQADANEKSFYTKDEMYTDLFRLSEQPANAQQVEDQQARIADMMRAKNLQSDEAMLEELNQLESKGNEISDVSYRRLRQLRSAIQTRRRLLN